jgi:hypothetical protein
MFGGPRPRPAPPGWRIRLPTLDADSATGLRELPLLNGHPAHAGKRGLRGRMESVEALRSFRTIAWSRAVSIPETEDVSPAVIARALRPAPCDLARHIPPARHSVRLKLVRVVHGSTEGGGARLAALRARPRRHAADEALPRRSPGLDAAPRAGPPRASALGHRAAVLTDRIGPTTADEWRYRRSSSAPLPGATCRASSSVHPTKSPRPRSSGRRTLVCATASAILPNIRRHVVAAMLSRDARVGANYQRERTT